MFIKYNGDNIHAFGYVEEDPKKISGGPQQIYWLRPGWNDFPSNIWKQYDTHPDVLKMLKDKKIELMNEKVTEVKGRRKVTSFVGMDDKPISTMQFTDSKAVEIIKGTLNRDILNRWLDEETRPQVKKALDKQVKPLLPGYKAET